MKRISNFLFSTRLMAVLILLFAFAIAIATFIENDFGSQTARATIYNAWWFNLLLFTGIVNLTGTIITAQLYRKEKRSILTFHLAFLLILIGAAITRFFGFEGYMHIREGETSNRIISGDNYFRMTASYNGEHSSAEKRVYFSALSGNYHKLNLRLDDKTFMAECLQMIPDAREFAATDPSGRPVVEMVVSGTTGRQTIVLSEGMNRIVGGVEFTLNDPANINGVNISAGDSGLLIYTPVQTVIMDMATQQADTLNAATYHPLRLMALYNFNGLMVVPHKFLPAGKIDVKTDENVQKDELPYAILIKISSGSQSKSIRYFASENALNDPVIVDLAGARLEISFGSRIIPVPFGLKLDKFILERYPGSESPSWFESKIVLTDMPAGILENRRVYMNNVLKYNGYRFYQSSYDTDEKGTVLSVNHDLTGTVVTYGGYILLAAGIILSLLNKKSRFRKLSVELDNIRHSGIPLIVLFFVFGSVIVPYNSSAQSIPDSVFIDREQAAKFSELLIQDPGGRIKPINTLSSELVRKVSGKTGLLQQTPDQVFLGMLAYPEYWQNVPMIKISHPEIKKLLRTNSSQVSFSSVFDFHSNDNPYILGPYVNEAYQKKPAARSTFDTELIRIDERINLCYQVFAGNLLRIFPDGSDPAGTWHSPSGIAGVFTGNDSIFAASILPLYLQSLTNSSDVARPLTPHEALDAMHAFQMRFGNELMPPPFKIRMEILYNRINLFDRLGSYYGAIGLILLIIYFGSVFYPRIKIRPFYLSARFAVYLVFFLHLAGLIARWIISGHAPWSNGYEALVFIAFATVLAGIIFSKKSQVTLSVTAILAWLILFVAHLSWMDPEITNLVPVLKSYWLLIHVAIITASYGFLAMGALLAFTNLVLMIVQTRKNLPATGRMIAEFSIIIEMTLIAGLYMLTIGTFLGGVWANESWGRYWGWDPKETWALVSILIYAFVAHMRLVPGLKGNYVFNLMAFMSFSSIIMTYFGVNYYLSGLHSYAKGDPLPVPPFVYYTLAVSGLVALLAWDNQRKMRKAGKISNRDKQKPSAVVEPLNRQEEDMILK